MVVKRYLKVFCGSRQRSQISTYRPLRQSHRADPTTLNSWEIPSDASGSEDSTLERCVVCYPRPERSEEGVELWPNHCKRPFVSNIIPRQAMHTGEVHGLWNRPKLYSCLPDDTSLSDCDSTKCTDRLRIPVRELDVDSEERRRCLGFRLAIHSKSVAPLSPCGAQL